MRLLQTLIVGILLVFAGCTEAFDMRTDDADPKIVIYGALNTNQNLQEIQISSTSPYFSQVPNPPVSGANVIITSSQNEEIEYMESPVKPGTYCAVNSWSPTEGETYTLSVEVDFDNDGYPESYEATTTVPSSLELDSIRVTPITIMGHDNYAINIYGQDPPEENFYLFNFYVNGELTNSEITNYIITDDVFFNGEYINGITVQYFDAISEYEKDSEEVRKQSTYLDSGDLLDVETCMITKGYYDFLSQCMSEKRGENPMFGGPPSNIISNISNGAIGYFTISANSRQSGRTP